jgi:hypothetical protein
MMQRRIRRQHKNTGYNYFIACAGCMIAALQQHKTDDAGIDVVMLYGMHN